jgi:hypothetical protein
MAAYPALAEEEAQTVLVVDKAVDIVGSFAHFVRTAQAVEFAVVVVVVVPVPIADIALLSLDLVAPTVDIDQLSSVVNVGHSDHWNRVDNSLRVPSLTQDTLIYLITSM